MSDLTGKRVYWPRWRERSNRETGIVRATAFDAGEWALFVEQDGGELRCVAADEATTRGPEAS